MFDQSKINSIDENAAAIRAVVNVLTKSWSVIHRS